MMLEEEDDIFAAFATEGDATLNETGIPDPREDIFVTPVVQIISVDDECPNCSAKEGRIEKLETDLEELRYVLTKVEKERNLKSKKKWKRTSDWLQRWKDLKKKKLL